MIIDDGIECPLIEGCTLVGSDNYNQDANYDIGTCFITACTEPSSPNFVCRHSPDLCTGVVDNDLESGTPITSYVGIQGDTFTPGGGLIVGDNSDSSICGTFGCTDNGTENWASNNW